VFHNTFWRALRVNDACVTREINFDFAVGINERANSGILLLRISGTVLFSVETETFYPIKSGILL
jgi:hypothetical protein